MKKYYLIFIVLVVTVLSGSALSVNAQQLAFPGAEGFGRFTSGGRGGIVYEVTNLNSSGAGSLRQGLEMSGARTIIFHVSGTIQLDSDVEIKNGNLTVAGQTAPGDGITIKGSGLVIKANNIIIRYIRIRPGDILGRELDAIWGRNQSDIILDHCSFSWGIDEIASFYDNERFTMQWCILSESLYRSVHPKGDHGYGGIWGGKNGATFHHNLLAHHSSRNPRFNGARYNTTTETELVDFRNNVIYNWGGNSAYGGQDGKHNIIANYYKAGPATPSGAKTYRIVQPDYSAGGWYIADNYTVGNAAVTADNWSGGVQGLTSTQLAESRAQVPFAVAPVTTQRAVNAFESVLANVGVSHARDAVDARIVEEARTGTATYGGAFGANMGIIDSQTTVGGWPELAATAAPADTDKDGMPDEWETASGLDPADPTDRNGDRDSDGYTNLEEYLNSLIEISAQFLMSPPQQAAPADGVDGIAPGEVVLEWVHDAPSFNVYLGTSERQQDLVASGITANTFTLSDLSAATEYFWRAEAVAADGTIISSVIWSFSTLPEAPHSPLPAMESTGIAYEEVVFEWKSEASSDDLFLGTSVENMKLVASGLAGRSFTFLDLEPATKYFWRVDGVGEDGRTFSSDIWSFTTAEITSVNVKEFVEYFKCSPNPFSEQLEIAFELHAPQDVELAVYDVNHRLLRTLLKSSLAPGARKVQFNGKGLQDGMYICVLRTPEFKLVKRVVLIRK